jgi:Ca2+/H+ antiporter
MDDKLITTIIGILTGVVGLAVLATLVSKQAQTPQVLQSAGQAFSSILQAATSPVSGGFGLNSFNPGGGGLSSLTSL